MFFAEGKQPQMAPEEYLKNNLGSSWLPPLLYVLLALSLVSWAGIRHSSRSRRGRALFVFTVGIVLIMLASGVLRGACRGPVVDRRRHRRDPARAARWWWWPPGRCCPASRTGSAPVASCGRSSPSSTELGRRHPDVGIGVRPRGPLGVPGGRADVADLRRAVPRGHRRRQHPAHRRRRGNRDGCGGAPRWELRRARRPRPHSGRTGSVQVDAPQVPPREQARAIAEWIYAGRAGAARRGRKSFPGLGWLRQPESYSDREWILAIAQEYRALDSAASDTDD